MANRTIYTTPFRLNFPHLDAPHKQEGSNEEPKYSVGALFPKSGMVPDHVVAGVASSNDNIVQALNDVCMEAFGIPYIAAGLAFNTGFTAAQFPAAQGWTDAMIIEQGYATAGVPDITVNNAAQVGVNFPPPLNDGDLDFKKEKNNLGVMVQTTVVHETSVGMWKMNFKNKEAVECVNPQGTALIDPKSLYSGAWVVCQISVDAYVGKQGNVISIKLLNVQMAYNDERIGGGAPVQQAATVAFAGRAIANSNVEAGFGQNATTAVPNANSAVQPVSPAAVQPVQPVQPVSPAAVQPVQPVQPVSPAAVQPVQPVSPAPTGTVVMNDGLDYAAHIAAGHTDESLITQNLAKPNFLEPAQPTA